MTITARIQNKDGSEDYTVELHDNLLHIYIDDENYYQKYVIVDVSELELAINKLKEIRDKK